MRVPISDYAFIDLDAPTVAAWETLSMETGAATWNVWCRYCELWHEHGPQEGHRIAHCKIHTPYSATGYNLAFAGEWWTCFTIPPFQAPEG